MNAIKGLAEEVAPMVARILSAQAPARLVVKLEEAAEMLGCSRTQVRNLIESGKLRTVHIDSHARLAVADIERFVEDCKV